MDVSIPRTPRAHWWKVDGETYASTQEMLDHTEVPPEGRVVTYGFKNYDERGEIKGILQDQSFYPHGESSERVNLPAYARACIPIGSDWPLWRYGLVGAGMGGALVLSQFIPLVGIFGPGVVCAALGHHASPGKNGYGTAVGGTLGAGVTVGTIWAFNHWPVETSFLPVVGTAVAAGAVLGLCLGRKIHNHMLRKQHARGQWWDRSVRTSQVPENPINLAAAGLNLGLDYSSTYRRLEGAHLPEGARQAMHRLMQSTSTGGWTVQGPWQRTQSGVGLAWCRPVGSEPIVSPHLQLDRPDRLTLQARFVPPEEFESERPAEVVVESSADGKSWKGLGSFSLGEYWEKREVALPEVGRQQLRLTVRQGKQTGEVQLANLQVGEVWKDGQEGGPEALIDLATAESLPLEQRTRALERLAAMPEGVGWAVLHSLGEKKLALEHLPALIDRLPATLVAEDVEAAIARVLDSPVGKAIQEKGDAMLIGGVRVKRKT